MRAEPALDARRRAERRPGWLSRSALSDALHAWQPPLARREFWAVQLLVVAIAAGHVLLESVAGETFPALAFIPTSLFLVPVVYAALNFGIHGSLPTALWSAVLTVPNLVYFHHEGDRLGEIWQLGVVILVAAFVGQRVDREKHARQVAEDGERARRTSEQKYRGIFDHVAEAILVLGPGAEIENANEAAARLFSLSAAELRGRRIGDLLHIDLDSIAAGGADAGTVQPLPASGGRQLWIQPVLIPMSEEGVAGRRQLMLRDLTPEYERQRELEAYAKRTTDAREAERGRIARELHDGPVQSLILVWRRLDALGRLDDAALESEVRAAQRQVREAADELRRVSRDLRPSILDDLGLTSALRAEVSSFAQRTGIGARLVTVGTERRLGSERELALLRIAQEALRNVGQHARARRAVVRLQFEPARVRLSISDDGDGIGDRPPSDLVAAGRLGLIGMREQARLIDASLTIAGGRHGGTVVTVATPG